MFIISLDGENISFREAKSLGYLTDMKVYYGKRFKKFEFRGTKQKHTKYINIFKEFSKIKKSKYWDWVVSKHSYNEEYVCIKD